MPEQDPTTRKNAIDYIRQSNEYRPELSMHDMKVGASAIMVAGILGAAANPAALPESLTRGTILNPHEALSQGSADPRMMDTTQISDDGSALCDMENNTLTNVLTFTNFNLQDADVFNTRVSVEQSLFTPDFQQIEEVVTIQNMPMEDFVHLVLGPDPSTGEPRQLDEILNGSLTITLPAQFTNTISDGNIVGSKIIFNAQDPESGYAVGVERLGIGECTNDSGNNPPSPLTPEQVSALGVSCLDIDNNGTNDRVAVGVNVANTNEQQLNGVTVNGQTSMSSGEVTLTPPTPIVSGAQTISGNLSGSKQGNFRVEVANHEGGLIKEISAAFDCADEIVTPPPPPPVDPVDPVVPTPPPVTPIVPVNPGDGAGGGDTEPPQQSLKPIDIKYTVSQINPKTTKIDVSRQQLAINQRIASAGIKRLAITNALLDGKPVPKFSNKKGGEIKVSAAQLKINQRISEANLERTNQLLARLTGKKKETFLSQVRTIALNKSGMIANQQTNIESVAKMNAINTFLNTQSSQYRTELKAVFPNISNEIIEK